MASTEDELDSLALRRLLLLESLLKKKQLLAEYMKSGFFQLGKARFALGGHAVSALRIPDGDISALAKTVSSSQSLNDCPRPCVTRELITVTYAEETASPNNSNKSTTDVDELVNKISESSIIRDVSPKESSTTADVDELVNKISESSIIRDVSPKESSTNSEDSVCESSLVENSDKVANKKPINWFSALPPQSLRQAQSSFISSLQLAAACVSMQQELDVLDQHYLIMRKTLTNDL